MPKSKTNRKSKSGESRKTNRLKNGNHRYRPGMSSIPGAPNFMEVIAAEAQRTILGELDQPEEETYVKKPLPGGKSENPLQEQPHG